MLWAGHRGVVNIGLSFSTKLDDELDDSMLVLSARKVSSGSLIPLLMALPMVLMELTLPMVPIEANLDTCYSSR